MECVKCKRDSTRVLRSIKIAGTSQVLRDRKCNTCGHRFQTNESPSKNSHPGES